MNSAAAPLLLVRFGSLGDVVLTFAAGAALKQAHPERPIHFLVKSEYAELVRAQPWVSDVLALEGDERDLAGARAWRERLRAVAWSGVLDLQDNVRSRYLTAGLPAPLVRWQRKGLARRWWVWSRPLQAIGYRPRWVRRAWRRYLDAARHFGTEGDEPPILHLPDDVKSRVEAWWRERWGDRAVVTLVPAAAWPTKEYPEEYSLLLAHDLVARGYGVCLVSSAADRERLSMLSGWANTEPAAGWMTGSLLEAAAALGRAWRVITPDSGLMHVAAAQAVPMVVIFGSTVTQFGFAPAARNAIVVERNLRCRPCAVHGRTRCPLGHHGCMRGIPPQVMLEVLENVDAANR